MKYELAVMEDCEGRQTQPMRILASYWWFMPGTPTIRSMLRHLREETAEGFIECHSLRTIRFDRTNECVLAGDRLATIYREAQR